MLFNEPSQATVAHPSQAQKKSQASEHYQSPRPSVQDDDNVGDSPSSVGVTKEKAVAAKESSRPVKKGIGQRTTAKRVSSGPLLRKPTTPCLVSSKK